MDTILLAHGSGGRLTHQLVADIFFKHLGNEILCTADDAAVLARPDGRIAVTTDSFVVKPVFFPGGDIGKLAVCGTVNDLTAVGADAQYLTCGFIIEEGLEIEALERIVVSLGRWAREAGVRIVAGDTKVVGKQQADRLFITTTGVGTVPAGRSLGMSRIRPGDKIIVSGTIGDHGLAILSCRNGLSFDTALESDCAPLKGMIAALLERVRGVRFMRDPTRGGLSTTLNEITRQAGVTMTLIEDSIPVRDAVRGACELLGIDPLYSANEGKMVIIVDPLDEAAALETLGAHPYGEHGCTIGEITEGTDGIVSLRNRYGVERILDMPTAEQLPRIC